MEVTLRGLHRDSSPLSQTGREQSLVDGIGSAAGRIDVKSSIWAHGMKRGRGGRPPRALTHVYAVFLASFEITTSTDTDLLPLTCRSLSLIRLPGPSSPCAINPITLPS